MATDAQPYVVAYAAVVFLVGFLLPYLATALWVRRDARRRESARSTACSVAVLLSGPAFPVVVAVYLLVRPEAGRGAAPPERVDRVLRNVAVAAVGSFAVVAVASPPDPLTQVSTLAVALPALVAAGVLLAYRDVLAPAR